MADEAKSAEVQAPANKPRRALWVRFIHLAIRKYYKNRSQKEPELAADKAARRTALATVGILIFTAVLAWVGWSQLNEMQNSNDTTDHMVRIYRQQAAQIARQAGDTHELAVQAKEQAERTKTIAHQAVIQANAAQVAAKAADQSAKTAAAEFETSVRARLEITSIKAVNPHFRFELHLRVFACSSASISIGV